MQDSSMPNLADLLARAAADSPDTVAIVEAETGRRSTWAEIDEEATRVAHGLSRMGLVAGYRVAIVMTNRGEFVTSYFGTLRANLVAVPVNPRSTTGELVRVLVDSGARAVIADPATVTMARAAAAGIEDALSGSGEPDHPEQFAVPRVVAVSTPTVPGEISYDELRRDVADAVPATQDTEALAVLLYTSGTSGRPRGAMLSHRALVANLEQAAAVEPAPVGPTDVVLGVLPLFHVYGLNAVLGQVVRQGARLVLVDGFEAESALDIVEGEAVTVVPVAPPVFGPWAQLPDLRERLDGVRLVLSGSAPLSPEVAARFTERAGIGVHQGYGLTEAAPVVTSTLCSSGQPKTGSVGAALPGVRVRLLDETGREPEPGDPGEIHLAGDNLFSGYWPEGEGGPDREGWWATGDIGFLDPDGDLFLLDRLRDLVIVSGFNVYPTEVEDVLGEVEGVLEAAVVGVEDEETGEAVVAYVRRDPAVSPGDDELEAAVREHAAARLARFKQPSAVHVVDVLPHTATGKIAKGRLRATQRRRALGLLE